VLALISLLMACGFQPAGKVKLDARFAKTHIYTLSNAAIMVDLLQRQFQENKFPLVDQTQASIIINVLNEKTSKRILSVDSDGKARMYELELVVGIAVKDAEGKNLLPNQNINLSREFLFDINSVLGKSSEEQEIYTEMRNDAARLIMRRLQALSVAN
jgi:LPS-assembly lipoprotein